MKIGLFILLFVPMSCIDKNSEVSKSENRTLTKWKPLITDKGEINYNFGKDFDNWYNDRFFLRSSPQPEKYSAAWLLNGLTSYDKTPQSDE